MSDTSDTHEVEMQSPQWKDGGFQNSLPRKDGSMLRMIGKMISNDADFTTPESDIPVIMRSAGDFNDHDSKDLRITWLGHSTAIIEIDGITFLTDPVWSDRASPFSFVGPKRFHQLPISLKDLPKIDAVVITHDHYDHLDEETITYLKDSVPLFIMPLGVGAHLKEWGVAPEKIIERDWWGEVTIGSVTLTATPARHFSGRSLFTMFTSETLWCGWAISGASHKIYYSGDTAMFPDFLEIGERLGPFDITMIESGAYDELWADVHLGPEQAVQAHVMVQGNLMIPVHWGTFSLANHNWTEPAERVLAAAELAGVKTAFPKPGESIDISEEYQLVKWWPELPWKSAEEAPVVSTGLETVDTITPKNNIQEGEKFTQSDSSMQLE
ncbi:MAG: MBL fold metallo-hydrolase [Reichenbachiella sp.]